MTWRRGTQLFFHKTEYRVGALLAALVVILAVPALEAGASSSTIFAPVNEEDIVHNEQEIDPDDYYEEGDETGETKEEKGFDIQVYFTSGVTYNQDRELFTETFGNSGKGTVTSNVVNGMYTNKPVELSLSSDLTGILYRNGVETDQNFQDITLDGNYVLRLSDVNGNDLGSFCFRITEKYTNTSAYKIPQGFSVFEVIRDGQVVETSSDRVSMDEEGEYLITIRNSEYNLLYSYNAIVDHTAPTLALADLNENNTAKSSVDISDLEPGVTMVITREGELISNRQVLTVPGLYQIKLTDPAGNITMYQFIIYMYLTVSGTLALVILGSLYLGLMIYLIISRKNIRVR